MIISCQFFENSSSCPKLLLFWKIWKICATLKQQPLKIEFPAFPLFFGLCLSCFTLKYYHFFAHHSVFLVGKIAGKRWHRKEIKKFSLLFPHILCQLCEWWCWMDAMKNKIKKVFWHISLLTAPCDLVLFLLHLFKLRRRVVALKKRHVLGRAFNTHAEKEVDFQMYKL